MERISKKTGVKVNNWGLGKSIFNHLTATSFLSVLISYLLERRILNGVKGFRKVV